MRSLCLCLLLLFVLWLIYKRPTHCHRQVYRIDEYVPEPESDIVHDTDDLLDFAEIRDDLLQQHTPEQKIETIDERYKAAKRKTPEDKMTRGIYSSGEKRRLVEKLIRRPSQKTNTRPKLWRHEFSDRLRGDVVPTHQNKWEINKTPLTAEDSPQGIFTTMQSGVWAADGGGTPMKDDEHMLYTVSDAKPRNM